MLEIRAYASGSSGNCYTAADRGTTIMLDCGLPFRRLQRLLRFRLPDAVLVTHEHQDHAAGAADLMRRGVDVYMTAGTAEALRLEGHRLHIMGEAPVMIDNIQVAAFPVQHDAKEPCGFLLDDGEDRILYATDTYYLKYKFPGLTVAMIEANHSYDIIRRNVEAGVLDPLLAKRLTQSHFSIENVVDFFRANDLSKLREIWLIHLSDVNSDEEDFRRRVAEVTGKPVFVA